MMTHKILNRDPKDEILKAFRLFDDDETGKISFKNLKRVAKELGERMTDGEFPPPPVERFVLCCCRGGFGAIRLRPPDVTLKLEIMVSNIC